MLKPIRVEPMKTPFEPIKEMPEIESPLKLSAEVEPIPEMESPLSLSSKVKGLGEVIG